MICPNDMRRFTPLAKYCVTSRTMKPTPCLPILSSPTQHRRIYFLNFSHRSYNCTPTSQLSGQQRRQDAWMKTSVGKQCRQVPHVIWLTIESSSQSQHFFHGMTQPIVSGSSSFALMDVFILCRSYLHGYLPTYMHLHTSACHRLLLASLLPIDISLLIVGHVTPSSTFLSHCSTHPYQSQKSMPIACFVPVQRHSWIVATTRHIPSYRIKCEK